MDGELTPGEHEDARNELARAQGRMLAEELAADLATQAGHYKQLWELKSDDAAKASLHFHDQYWLETEVLETPWERLNWMSLTRLAQDDPEAAVDAWGRVNRAAEDELLTGHRAARAMEVVGGLPDRARFMALRDSFRVEWRPRGGIEDTLIDTMAQAFTAYETWLHRSLVLSGGAAWQQEKQTRKTGRWTPVLQGEADAVEQAAQMADRFNRLFLRTLRALRDLRRYSTPVVVQHASQVNVGQQQVNVVSG